jgi:hypothetical protein
MLAIELLSRLPRHYHEPGWCRQSNYYHVTLDTSINLADAGNRIPSTLSWTWMMLAIELLSRQPRHYHEPGWCRQSNYYHVTIDTSMNLADAGNRITITSPLTLAWTWLMLAIEYPRHYHELGWCWQSNYYHVTLDTIMNLADAGNRITITSPSTLSWTWLMLAIKLRSRHPRHYHEPGWCWQSCHPRHYHEPGWCRQ